MKIKQEVYDVGVIVGRFQVPELHEAHRNLIQHVVDQHERTLVFLGLSPLMVTRENPLDFEARKQMLLAEFPEITVLYIKDIGSDPIWSNNLNGQIYDHLPPGQNAVLYGGRGSFIEHYHGPLPTRELEQDIWVSGTALRKKASKQVKASPEFRAGVVWAAYSRFPTVYTTVDVAIFNSDYTKLLLGRKADEAKYRFIGGFADPGSDSYEADAHREVMEETGIEIEDLRYIGSFNIDDWRYRREQDCIRTMLFVARHKGGDPQPGDDIAEVRCFSINDINYEAIMPNHHQLLTHVRANTQPLDTDTEKR